MATKSKNSKTETKTTTKRDSLGRPKTSKPASKPAADELDPALQERCTTEQLANRAGTNPAVRKIVSERVPQSSPAPKQPRAAKPAKQPKRDVVTAAREKRIDGELDKIEREEGFKPAKQPKPAAEPKPAREPVRPLPKSFKGVKLPERPGLCSEAELVELLEKITGERPITTAKAQLVYRLKRAVLGDIKTLSTDFPADVLDAFDAIAAKRSVSRVALLREVVGAFVAANR